MLFQSRFHEAIRRGDITCTVRIWKQLRVRVGRAYPFDGGSIHIDRVQEIEFDGITPLLARRSGFASVVELLKVAKHGAGERIFFIEFHYEPAPPSRKVRTHSVDAESLQALTAKLDGMDARARAPWTRQTLQAIAQEPGLRAADLAAALGRERLELKRDIRKLKGLGLTVSLDTGYQLSERGLQLLARIDRKGTRVRPKRASRSSAPGLRNTRA